MVTAPSGGPGARDGGRVISLEPDRTHAEIARANIGRAGLGELVEVRWGRRWTTTRARRGT